MPKVSLDLPACRVHQMDAQTGRPLARPMAGKSYTKNVQQDTFAHETPRNVVNRSGRAAAGAPLDKIKACSPPSPSIGASSSGNLGQQAIVPANASGYLGAEAHAAQCIMQRLEQHLSHLTKAHKTKAETSSRARKSKRIMDQVSIIQAALNDDRKESLIKCFMNERRSIDQNGTIVHADFIFLTHLAQFSRSDLNQVSRLLHDTPLRSVLVKKYSKNSTIAMIELMTPSLSHFQEVLNAALIIFPAALVDKYFLGTAIAIMKGSSAQMLTHITSLYTSIRRENEAQPASPNFVSNTLSLVMYCLSTQTPERTLTCARLLKQIQDLGFQIDYGSDDLDELSRFLSARGQQFLHFLQVITVHLAPSPFQLFDALPKKLLTKYSLHPEQLMNALILYGNAYRAAAQREPRRARSECRSAIEAILDTPAESMIAHARTLATRLEIFQPADDLMQTFSDTYRGNLENVMQGSPIQRTKMSILALDSRFPRRPGTKDVLASILTYLRDYPRRASSAEKEVFLRQRGGAAEVVNAARTLIGPPQAGDFSEALAVNTAYDLGPKSMGLGDITALIWHAIDAYNPSEQTAGNNTKDQDLMRYAVFKALSQCIEDDGHRVCAVGFAQRITTSLQGYYKDVVKIDEDYLMTSSAQRSTVSPALLFTEASSDFDRSLPSGQEPSPQQLRLFAQNTLRQATDVYGAGAEQVKTVVDMLKDYLQMTYDWTPEWTDAL